MSVYRLCTVFLLSTILTGIASAVPRSTTVDEGLVGITVSNTGFIGNAFNRVQDPSCEYPVSSGVEHLYLGGVWIGGRLPDGRKLVSTSVQDASFFAAAEEMREFEDTEGPGGEESLLLISNQQNRDNYSASALAPTHVEATFTDFMSSGPVDHTPLGIRVVMRVLAWPHALYDDFVIFDFTVENVSGERIEDVYVGIYTDTTVGNTAINNPYDPFAPIRWDFYDGVNGAWRPGDVPSDPTLWMMSEHDEDGDGGWATSWVGCRLLGTVPEVSAPIGTPPVSYNSWPFRWVPVRDDWYQDVDNPEITLPGKYQIMSNGHFDVGVTPEFDFTLAGNRSGLLSTGPFPVLMPNESVRVTFAMVLGQDETHLLRHSRLAKLLYDFGYEPQVSAVGEGPSGRPALGMATPNPFNPTTRLSYELAKEGHASLKIYDTAGHLVATLVDERQEMGAHHVIWNGRDSHGRMSAAGVYLYQLEADGVRETRRVSLVK
jgi:hypothetical protein